VDDALAQVIRRQHPRSSVMVPRFALRYRPVALKQPSSTLQQVNLPVGLLDASRLVGVVDLDAVAQRGPFVLDLLARYVSPVDRLRILASRDRAVVVAEVNLARKLDLVVISCTLRGQRVFAATNDLIAGELVALALGEMVIGGERQWQTPWEDAVVQRATEMELGARFPGDITIASDDQATSPVVAATTAALHLRLGI
jgi:hypothetical protein